MATDAPPTTANLYDTLAERGLVSQTTDEKIAQRLDSPVTLYCGFDPTADSLHIGSLVPIMGLAHAQRCGHKPLVLVGGATGLVGDPSGKTEARQMLSEDDIRRNADTIAAQIGRVVRFDDSPSGGKLVNNIDWFADITWIDVLRRIGARMSVNRMLSMDSVKGRIDSEQGISYLEFSYMLMQAYDFVHLNLTEGCTVQLGGQDQWGNIVMGIELGRKLRNFAVHAPGLDDPLAERIRARPESLKELDGLTGLTFPLVTKADGGKFGKSERGNIWLDAARTSPYEFYQFWRNVADADVGRFLGYFTFLPMSEVTELASREGAELNAAKERLAYEVTRLIHGETEAEAARDSARKAFSATADVTGESIPHEAIAADELGDLRTLMVRAGLAKSNGEAKKLIQGGGVRIGDQPISDITYEITRGDITDGYVLIRVGKKRMFRYDVSG